MTRLAVRAAPWLLSLAAGLGQALALAWPGSGAPLWWLQILALALFAHVLRSAGGWRRAAALGWLCATAWLCGTFWWLFISMHTYGGLAAPLAALGVLALAAFLAGYYAVASGIFWAVAPANKALSALVFAGLWTLAELARGQWWTGFPWGAGGYAHVDGPLAVLARSVGVYGIGLVAAALAMALAQWRLADLRHRRWWFAVGGLVLAWSGLAVQRGCALGGCGGAGGAHSTTPLTLELLQGNIPQDEKFQPGSGVPLALAWYAGRIEDARAQLVVAPETAIPLLPQQLTPGYLDDITRRYRSGAQALLLGIPLGSLERGYTNSVLGFTPGQGRALYRYDKHHLVPFGEFIPPLFKWFTELMHIPLGDFSRGGLNQPSLAWAGQRIAPNICYEDLFGEELAVRFADTAGAPTMLVNLSNIGWFGDSLAIAQHLAISRMRALEFERPMIRATNTGATAVIDHLGRVTDALAPHTRGVLRAQVVGRSGAVTPYAWWAARAGLAPLWVLGLGLALGAWVLRRQRTRHRQRAIP